MSHYADEAFYDKIRRYLDDHTVGGGTVCFEGVRARGDHERLNVAQRDALESLNRFLVGLHAVVAHLGLHRKVQTHTRSHPLEQLHLARRNQR